MFELPEGKWDEIWGLQMTQASNLAKLMIGGNWYQSIRSISVNWLITGNQCMANLRRGFVWLFINCHQFPNWKCDYGNQWFNSRQFVIDWLQIVTFCNSNWWTAFVWQSIAHQVTRYQLNNWYRSISIDWTPSTSGLIKMQFTILLLVVHFLIAPDVPLYFIYKILSYHERLR